MFGTDRTISTFDLYIEKLDDGDERERCTVWGSASYTSETDFRHETTDDCLSFYLYVRPEKFAWYAERIAVSAVDEVVFRVGRVAGFYSDWSPSISTNEIKVLTTNEEHEVEIPNNCGIVPPRLKKVTKVELYFRRVRKLDRAGQEAFEEASNSTNEDEIPAKSNDGIGPALPLHPSAVAIARATNLLSSLRIAVWVIAGLLLLILITNHN